MTREEKLQKAHQMFDNRNLLIELKWQREYFKRGYVSNQEELFNLWIFDECIKALEQEPKTGYCKDCKYFEYDSVAKVDGIPLIVGHEICKRWGDGCKTREDGYCFLFELQKSEDKE